jgi:hemerythrin-like metal-binding protein
MVPVMTWNADLQIGDAGIDAQHRILVDLINRLSRVIDADAVDEERLIRTLLEVRKYAEFHFLSEENFMREIGYPALAEHERLHSQLLSELGVRTVKARQHWRSARDVVAFLIDWLNQHIALEDKKFAVYTARARAKELLQQSSQPIRKG